MHENNKDGSCARYETVCVWISRPEFRNYKVSVYPVFTTLDGWLRFVWIVNTVRLWEPYAKPDRDGYVGNNDASPVVCVIGLLAARVKYIETRSRPVLITSTHHSRYAYPHNQPRSKPPTLPPLLFTVCKCWHHKT